ncbi:MAG: lysophospholipase [Treponema sp.]|jgi:alpha-beta hydrolase superfamily lysophospholipase|nr:lysophospholipase [Treponema sp.]
MDEMQKSEQWITVANSAKLLVRRWSPHGKVRAVLNIAHGMAEHGGRYKRLAERLVGEGIEVWVADMRGHGKTADISVNDPGNGGLLGHCADENAVALVTSDIDAVNNAIIKEHSNTPLFLLGHSWGSFLVQNYIETYNNTPLAGCILSGARGPDGLLIAASKPVMSLIAAFRGGRARSKLAHALAIGPYNRPFKPNRTTADWLSRDEREVDAYVADELCGNMSSAGFFRDLAILLNKIHKKDALSNIKRDLPIYIFCGSADPVGDMGKSPMALAAAYRNLGIQDLEFALYPDARHETLNETNREEVIGNLASWLTRHIG